MSVALNKALALKKLARSCYLLSILTKPAGNVQVNSGGQVFDTDNKALTQVRLTDTLAR